MAFVASNTPAVSGPLPVAVDVGSGTSFTLFSYVRMVGAGTLTFDTGQVCTGLANLDSVFPIPPAARIMTIGGGTPTVQFGQMVG